MTEAEWLGELSSTVLLGFARSSHAGCASTDMLTHLRGPGPHARGCWGVDRLLGKS